MVTALTAAAILTARWGDDWLIAAEAATFWAQLRQFQQQWHVEQPRTLLLAEPEPIRFLAAFFAAVQQPGQIWLANPHWGQQEWSQVAVQCQPDVVVGTVPPGFGIQSPLDSSLKGSALVPASPPFKAHGPDSATTILIPTGGSSGHLRFAAHTWDTLAASVIGFCQYFECDRVRAYCVLPLHHVSGLMQAMRCLLSGGQLVIQPFADLVQRGALTSPAGDCASPGPTPFLSLVPTQLQRLLMTDWDAVPWLRQFHAILLGGAPAWPRLLNTARAGRLPLAPTYGMTETASQVATLLPSEFLAGRTGSGRALPHAQLIIVDGARQLSPGQVGQIAIAADSLAIAVGPTAIAPPLLTGDLGYLDAWGSLHVVGRAQSMIITGGEKVSPAEVEAAILATELVLDVAVLGLPDADWGEQVVAVVVAPDPNAWSIAELGAQLQHHLRMQLSPYKIPKRWLGRAALPRNGQGKLNRTALHSWVADQIAPTAATTRPVPGSTRGAGG